jgi:hypothetical protein
MTQKILSLKLVNCQNRKLEPVFVAAVGDSAVEILVVVEQERNYFVAGKFGAVATVVAAMAVVVAVGELVAVVPVAMAVVAVDFVVAGQQLVVEAVDYSSAVVVAGEEVVVLEPVAVARQQHFSWQDQA